jgi:hypothetical protein
MLINLGASTVVTLISTLSDHPNTSIQWAAQQSWSRMCPAGQVMLAPYGAAGEGTQPAEKPVVWLGLSNQAGSLPTTARSALRW